MTRKTRLHVETLDDRCVPATLSVGDVTMMEGTSGVQNAAVTVTLSGPLNKSVSVDYGTANGAATAGSDYTAAVGRLTFARGETVKTILVPVYGDQIPEQNESFYVGLSNSKGAMIADNHGVVTIVDSSPRLSIEAAAGDEGSVITFTVTLASALDTPFTVDFATGDTIYADGPGYADAGQDYVATSGTLTFAPGETTKTFTVQIIADDVEEYDEMFFVRLSNPSTPALITGGGWYEFDTHGYIYGEWGAPPE
jgi:hypothetical protein